MAQMHHLGEGSLGPEFVVLGVIGRLISRSVFLSAPLPFSFGVTQRVHSRVKPG